MKRLGVFLLPPGWDASPSQGYPPALCSPVPIYTPGWRGAQWELSVLHKNTTQCPRPGLEPGPLDPEMSALTMRPPRLPHIFFWGIKTLLIKYSCRKDEPAFYGHKKNVQANIKCSRFKCPHYNYQRAHSTYSSWSIPEDKQETDLQLVWISGGKDIVSASV